MPAAEPAPARRPAAEAALALALLLPGAAATAQVDVRAAGDRVAVTASAAPLAEVLDRLAAAVGMEVEYEGAPPRQLITLSLAERTSAEAVLAILDGQGLDYALQLDGTGTGATRLFITSATSAAPGRPPAPVARPRGRRAPVPVPPPALEDLYQDQAEDEPDPDAPVEDAAGQPSPITRPGRRPPRTFPTPIPPQATPGAPLIFPGPLAVPVTTPTPQPEG